MRIGSASQTAVNIRDGYSSFVITLYKRSLTAIETAGIDKLFFTFKNNSLSSGIDGKTLEQCLNGWSRSVPNGANPLYCTSATAFGNKDVDDILPNEWLTPTIMSENGTKGETGLTTTTIILYKRSEEIPSVPQGEITYDFYSGEVTGSLSGWSTTLPDFNGKPLWGTNAVVSATLTETTQTGSITKEKWSVPKKIVADGKDGKSPVESYIDAYNFILVADSYGIVSASEYTTIDANVTLMQKGEYLSSVDYGTTLENGNFYMTRAENSITNTTINKNKLLGTKESVMLKNSASVILTITYKDFDGELGSFVKTIYIRKISNPKEAEPMLFAWSSSADVFTPKENMRVWMFADKFIQFDNKLIGDFPLYNFVSWDEVMKAKSDDYPYLWCKYSVDGDPLPFSGRDGKNGLNGQYTAFQYYASTSDTTQQGGAWSDTMPSIAGGKYLWMRTQVVPAGGSIDSEAWGTPVLAGTDISKLMASIDVVKNDVTQNTALINANSSAIATKVNQTTYDDKVSSLESSIQQNATNITTKVTQSEYNAQIQSMQSTIEQTSKKIALTIETVDGEQVVKYNGIVISEKDGEGNILIRADKILLDGSVTADKLDVNTLNSTYLTINGTLSNEVLDTIDTAKEGENVSIGSVDDTNKWYLKSQAEAKIKSLITANQLYSFSNGENINGNASLKLLNNTDDSWASSGAIPNYYYISQAINGISAGVDTTGDYGGMAYGNGYLIWGSYRTFFRIKIATDSGAGFTYNSFDSISEKIPWYNKNLSRHAKTRIVFNKDNNLFYLFCNYADLSAGDNYNKCFFATSSNGDSWSVGVNGSPFECSFSSNFYAQYMEDSKSIYLWGTKKGDTKTTQVEVYSTNGYGTNDTASIEALNLTLYTMMATSKHLDYMATIDTGAYVQETKVYYKNGGTITSFHEATNLPSGKLTRFIKFKSNLYAIFNYNALYKISDDTYAPVFTKVFDFSSPSATTTNLNVFITEDYLIIKKKIGETYYNYIYDGTNYYTPQGTENWIDNAFLWNSEIDIYPICNGKNVYYTYDNKLIRVYRGKRGFQQKLVVLGGDYNDLGAFSTYVSGTLINTPIKASSLNLPTTIPSNMDTYRRIPTLFTQTAVYLSLASASVESYTRFDTTTKQDVIVPAYSGKPNKVTTSPQVFTINNTEYANSNWFIKNKTALAISFTPNAVAKGVYTGDLNPKEVDGEAASNRDIGNITPYDTITGREITANEKLIAGNIEPKTASANIGSANQKFDQVYAKTVNSQTENTDTINSSNVNITSKFRVQTDKVEIGTDIESGYVNIRNIDLSGVFWHIDAFHDQLRFVRQGSTVQAYITESGLYGAVFN